ncbi:RNA polymerase sigma factor (sigma-70 family) [Microbacteriaceae bacterium SG_E_30_P1]|uniref:RNA polymerase sigma factor (Sigma-70 family) n=1 Tax=Antiquaquibacter oligotrophicus TaxID=2880260 RepID=A0ABT6KR50_9MICO|nr:sigma-70 family RNA polymerase sigma factor [Antiquaquibacter oligotrophicus]MDH6181958.1 RNA polymerase sigma factor (sigma-70 family) [Antiquaquibacter oligotrophicus]UDF12373.1 sigma-70 family RNA polymerase sigma factor [Antiquaquibacter oligotrophicus]
MSDEEDWSAAVAGDGEAFGRIYDRHRDRVTRHSLRLVPTPADADDVVAITFMESWRRRDQVRFVDNSVLPWLLVTATNAARNLSRSARRYHALLARLPATEPAPDHAERFDDNDAIAALRTLSAADQRVVALCVLEGLSEREAAAALGVPPGTVKSRLSRAKRRLAERVPRPSFTLKEETES